MIINKLRFKKAVMFGAIVLFFLLFVGTTVAYITSRINENKEYVIGTVKVRLKTYFEKDGNIYDPVYYTADLGDSDFTKTGVVKINISARDDIYFAENFRVDVEVYSDVDTYFRVATYEQLTLLYKTGDGGATSPYTIEEVADPKLTDVIKTNAVNENGYRYEGTNPNNYIYMTNKSTNEKELWRIIGVFNDGANGEEVIRVRRHYEKDNYPGMAYDENNTNHFPNTTMYSTLSSTYNLTNYNHTVNYMMYLGTSNTSESLTSSGLYTMERGETPGVTAATNYSNAVRFTGSVGLMYPSDYGYAVLASDCARSILAIEYNETETCYNNNWLFQGNNKYQWLISPSTFDDFVTFNVNSNGLVYGIYSGDYDAYGGSVRYDFAYSPVMALSNNVLVSGSGTKTDPYTIAN